jgi:hypothetical protein
MSSKARQTKTSENLEFSEVRLIVVNPEPYGFGVGVAATAAPTQVKSLLSLAAPAESHIG